MGTVKNCCPKCGQSPLQRERHPDGLDHYCPVCGYRVTTVIEIPAPATPPPPRLTFTKLHDHICEYCGVSFRGSKVARYCSGSHRALAYRERVKAKAV